MYFPIRRMRPVRPRARCVRWLVPTDPAGAELSRSYRLTLTGSSSSRRRFALPTASRFSPTSPRLYVDDLPTTHPRFDGSPDGVYGHPLLLAWPPAILRTRRQKVYLQENSSAPPGGVCVPRHAPFPVRIGSPSSPSNLLWRGLCPFCDGPHERLWLHTIPLAASGASYKLRRNIPTTW